jgi:hypothetical protein
MYIRILPADTFYPGINIPSNPKYLRDNDGNDNQMSTKHFFTSTFRALKKLQCMQVDRVFNCSTILWTLHMSWDIPYI